MLVMNNISKDKKRKILAFPKSLLGLASFMVGKALILYSLFVPIKPFTINFFIGTTIYIFGLISSVYAMWTFSKADLDQPVTHGLYKLSRHPMQVMSFVMWLGIAIVSCTWIMIVCALLFAIASLPSLVAQEQYCIDKYGDVYKSYIKITPRYFGII
jgi:protein-S-isoprenylcysteine O-methyltransferase Ste14